MCFGEGNPEFVDAGTNDAWDDTLQDGIALNGDVDGFVEVVDPDDSSGGEQCLVDCDEFGRPDEDFTQLLADCDELGWSEE